MARFDMDRWLNEPDTLGARFSSKDLRGALGGLFAADRMTVPEGVAALVTFDDGSRRLLKPGEEAVGAFNAVVVKARDIDIDVGIPALLTAEDLPVTFLAELEIFVDTSDDEAIADFGQEYLGTKTEATEADVFEAFLPDIEEVARNYISARQAEELFRGDHSDAMEKAIRKALQKDLFESGITLVELRSVRFQSEEYEKILKMKQVATGEEERARRLEIIRQAWVKDQKDEILSNKEVKDLVRALEHEGALKEIERRKQKVLAEKELQRIAQEAAEERLEAESRSTGGLMKLLEEAGFKDVMEKFSRLGDAQAASTTGLDPRLHEVPDGRCRRVLCAAGRRVLAFRPDKSSPLENYDFSSGGLGMLRSVRLLHREGQALLAAGAQFGVYLQPAQGAGRRELRLPGAGDRRGGVNAVAVLRDRLFATHSDYGLVAWDLSAEGDAVDGEIIRTDLTAGARTCRGVQIGLLDRLLFAADDKVHSLLPESLEGTPTTFTGAPDAITSIVTTSRSVFAGTAGGEVLRWEFESPEAAPRREIAKRPDPIFMLKTACVAGAPTLLIGWKSYAVLTKKLEIESETSYPCDYRIRWVDGAADAVFGVDRDGRRLFAWEAGNPRARPVELHAEERIQDIHVWVE